MNIVRLLLISLFGTIGIVYIYSGRISNNRLFLWCGIALAVLPLVLSHPLLIAAVETVLAAAPVLAPKAASRFAGKPVE